MYALAICSLLLCGILASAHQHHPHVNHKVVNKRTSTPDNTCGGSNGYTCDPHLPQGGSCCSAHGFCGKCSNLLPSVQLLTFSQETRPTTVGQDASRRLEPVAPPPPLWYHLSYRHRLLRLPQPPTPSLHPLQEGLRRNPSNPDVFGLSMALQALPISRFLTLHK